MKDLLNFRNLSSNELNMINDLLDDYLNDLINEDEFKKEIRDIKEVI